MFFKKISSKLLLLALCFGIYFFPATALADDSPMSCAEAALTLYSEAIFSECAVTCKNGWKPVGTSGGTNCDSSLICCAQLPDQTDQTSKSAAPAAADVNTCAEVAKAQNSDLISSKCAKVGEKCPDGWLTVTMAETDCGTGFCCAEVKADGKSATPATAITPIPAFPNPLGSVSVPGLVNRIINGLLGIVGALFFVMFLWGGVAYMTAGGKGESVKKAVTTLTNAVIGMVIVAMSYVIVSFIIDVLVKGRGGS